MQYMFIACQYQQAYIDLDDLWNPGDLHPKFPTILKAIYPDHNNKAIILWQCNDLANTSAYKDMSGNLREFYCNWLNWRKSDTKSFSNFDVYWTLIAVDKHYIVIIIVLMFTHTHTSAISKHR